MEPKHQPSVGIGGIKHSQSRNLHNDTTSPSLSYRCDEEIEHAFDNGVIEDEGLSFDDLIDEIQRVGHAGHQAVIIKMTRTSEMWQAP